MLVIIVATNASVALKNFWVSWYHVQELFGDFTLHSPWWDTGSCFWPKTVLPQYPAVTICAAIKAETMQHALAIVGAAYDKPRDPGAIEFRFANERQSGWEPFGDRFTKSDWMLWD